MLLVVVSLFCHNLTKLFLQEMKQWSFTDNTTRNKLGNNMQPVIASYIKQGCPVAQADCSDFSQLSPACFHNVAKQQRWVELDFQQVCLLSIKHFPFSFHGLKQCNKTSLMTEQVLLFHGPFSPTLLLPFHGNSGTSWVTSAGGG